MERKHDMMRIPRQWLVAVAGIIFAVAVVVFVGKCFIGAAHTQDEGYQAMNCMYYGDAPLAMLSFFNGYCVLSLLGDNIIWLRLLRVVCYMVAILLPLWYFYRRTRDWVWTLGLGSFLIMLIMGNAMELYGWDVGAYPFESALLVSSCCYIDRPGRKLAVLCGVVCGLMVMARITTGVLGLPIFIAVLLAGRMLHNDGVRALWGTVALTFGAMFVTILTVVIIMKGDVMSYISAWNADNIITGHGFRDMLYGYLRWAWDDVVYYSRLLKLDVVIICCCLLTIAYGKVFGRFGYLAVMAVILLFLIFKRMGDGGGVFGKYLVPVVLLVYLFLMVRGREENWAIDKWKIFLVLAFALLPAVGSDRVLLRLTFFYSIPLLMAMVYNYRNEFLKLMFLYLTIPALACWIYWEITKYGSYCRAEEFLPRHQYILGDVERCRAMGKLSVEIDRLKAENKRFGVFGDSRYEVSYLFEEEKPFHFQAFHYYYREQTRQWIKDYADSLDAVVMARCDLPCMTYEEVTDLFGQYGMKHQAEVGDYVVFSKD